MSAIFGETLTFRQENGPEVELVAFGDEFYARAEKAYAIVQTSETAAYGNIMLRKGCVL